MSITDAMIRIQNNARSIKFLVKSHPSPEQVAEIEQRAQLIERESAHVAGIHTTTQGNA
jgi:tetrahydromethanopterin S-methyltransferase subunit F